MTTKGAQYNMNILLIIIFFKLWIFIFHTIVVFSQYSVSQQQMLKLDTNNITQNAQDHRVMEAQLRKREKKKIGIEDQAYIASAIVMLTNNITTTRFSNIMQPEWVPN